MEVSCVLRPSAFELERLTAWAFGIWFFSVLSGLCHRSQGKAERCKPRKEKQGRHQGCRMLQDNEATQAVGRRGLPVAHHSRGGAGTWKRSGVGAPT